MEVAEWSEMRAVMVAHINSGGVIHAIGTSRAGNEDVCYGSAAGIDA